MLLSEQASNKSWYIYDTEDSIILVSDMSIVRWILLGLPLCVLRINGFSLSVTRGYQDSIYTNIQPESTPRLICDDNVCKCKNGLTYIFDSDSLSGKCVRDYEIIKDRSSKYRINRLNIHSESWYRYSYSQVLRQEYIHGYVQCR